MARLLVLSSAPVVPMDGGHLLDIKFVEGMRLVRDLWDGPVGCLLRAQDHAFPFARTYAPGELPFDLTVLPREKAIGPEDIAGHDVIQCSGDSYDALHLPDLCREKGIKLVYVIENIPRTRQQIIALDTERSLPGKLRGIVWVMTREPRRRRAFRKADGLQANGYPAFSLYGPLNSNTMMFLDNRVSADLLATAEEMAAREARLAGGAPLRLVHSGRLEPLKGAQDLVPVARRLASRGVDFTLDIFGTGRLEGEIGRQIAAHGLQDRVRLHGAVDFATELVPFSRKNADIYLSCHRQSDPSCTYVESMGCGLAVAGYDNRMWSALCSASGAGWSAPLGRAAALADVIARVARDRQEAVRACRAAQGFAAAHAFEHEFRKRIAHLAALV